MRCLMSMMLLLIGAAAAAQIDLNKPVEVTQLADGIYVVMGVGGNIGVSYGADGMLIIDDDMPPLSGKIAAALKTIQDEPVRMVFNTHWHFDHTGGNKYFGEQGALIVAQDNVRRRMSTEQFSKLSNTTTPPSPDVALPVVTFDTSMTFHINDMTLRAVHIAAGHTDGDAVVFFEEANIVHMGDLFFNQMYPVMDLSAGGSARGMLAAIDAVLPLLDEDTIIIPGHGPVADVDDLKAFRAMLATVTNRIQLLIDDGKSVDEVVALQPTVNYDATWAWKFMPAERFVGIIYDSLVSTPGDATEQASGL